MPIKAEVICDSISPQAIRVTTFKLRYPKFIHGEFMTHRVISRNASSSRAIPTEKLIEEVLDDNLRASPIFWGKNQKGMQAVEELSEERTLGSIPGAMYSPKWSAQRVWSYAAWDAAQHARKLVELGAHKQIVNRLLEPFSHINVIATATEWDNFFGLRLHKDAQPEMRALAIAMWEAYKVSTPKFLKPGEWHLPLIRVEDTNNIAQMVAGMGNGEAELDLLRRMSVARCARVSYESFETGKISTPEEDCNLHDRLLGAQPLHASPAEHQCTPDEWLDPYHTYDAIKETNLLQSCWRYPHEHGNFVGFRQYRKMLKNEACAPMPEGF